jgi:hypothetical protein
MPAEPEITPKLVMPPVKILPAIDRGLGREDFAGAVDEDAVAHRLDAAAVDDCTGDSAVE